MKHYSFSFYISPWDNVHLPSWIFNLNLKPKDFPENLGSKFSDYLVWSWEKWVLCTSLNWIFLSRSPNCERVCVLESYRKFPVELIVSFFHFSFFFLSVLPGKSGINQWNVFSSSQWFFFLTLIHGHQSLPWPIFPVLFPQLLPCWLAWCFCKCSKGPWSWIPLCLVSQMRRLPLSKPDNEL